MPETPAARQRLAEQMDARRLELGMRWQDVAAEAGVSLKTLYSVRTGEGGVTGLTQGKVEKGLRWGPGSVESILGGGDPVPLPQAGPPPDAPPSPDGEPRDDAAWDLFPDDPAKRHVWRIPGLSEKERAAIIALIDRGWAESAPPERQADAG